jgi:dTDP-glucose 4,6-dehydratase
MVAIKYLMITGCAGFIGSNFVRYLLKKNLKYKILGLDNLSYASNINSINEFKKSKQFIFLKRDISNIKHLEKIFKKMNIVHVINFAAETHVDNSIKRPDVFIKTNIVDRAKKNVTICIDNVKKPVEKNIIKINKCLTLFFL